jgi:SET domain
MKRTERLRHILADCYCRLQPSSIHGIGVYAIRDIPKGKNPFRTLPAYGRRSGYVRITDEELVALPPGLFRLLRALFVPTDGTMHIPTTGTNIVYLAAYVNHSATPNLRTTDGFNFLARRKIREGEELTADYRTYGAEELLASH